MRFKEFLLNEQRAYLGQKVGDVLTAVQELRDDSKNMGSRDLVRFSQKIVNQLRRILHSNWPREEKKHLLAVQKVAVAIMKAIDEKDDLPTIISGAASSLEKLVGDLGVPIHRLATGDKKGEEEKPKGIAEPEEKQGTSGAQGGTMQQNPAAPTAPPPNPPVELGTPPLGGNAGPLQAF